MRLSLLALGLSGCLYGSWGRGRKADDARPVEATPSSPPAEPGCEAALRRFAEGRERPARAATSLGCVRERRTLREGWDVEILAREVHGAETFPTAADSTFFVWAQDRWRRTPLDLAVPGAPGRTFDHLLWPRADTAGRIVMRGAWHGHADQANGIGMGLYLLDDDRACPIVDAFTTIPGRDFRFNELGIPDVEGGTVTFWGGRGGGDWSGIYRWEGGRIATVFDSAGPIRGWGTPDSRAGRVAVLASREGEEQAVYLWDASTREARRLAGIGDRMPGSRERIALVFDPVVGKQAVFFGVGHGEPGPNGTASRRSILGWNESGLFLVADHAWFARGGSQLYIQPSSLSADEGGVAFTVGAGPVGEVWLAEGCRLERVVATGDRALGGAIGNIWDLDDDALRGGSLRFSAALTNGGGSVVARARRSSRTR